MTPLSESDVVDLALSLEISTKMARLLAAVFNRTIVTYSDLHEMGISGHRVMVQRMRDILEKKGILVDTKHGTGYWMDSESREKILSALKRVRTATPGAGK